MNIIVLAPYSNKIVKAIDGIKKIEIGSIIIIGNKERFTKTCSLNKIDCSGYKVYDYEVENLIIQRAMELYTPKDLVIVGEISLYYQKKLFAIKDTEDFQCLSIIDLPQLRHFLFVCNYQQKHNIDFDDKKKTIIEASKYMMGIGIKRVNVAFISSVNSKADMLEASIMRTILKEHSERNIQVYDSFKLYELFTNSEISARYSNINLLVLKSFEASRMFIATMSSFTDSKVGIVNTYKGQYLINTEELKDEQSILFSILVTNRVMKNQKTGCTKKQFMV